MNRSKEQIETRSTVKHK